MLFDRDGTLIVDVPYNGDPQRVEPMATALDAVQAVRAAGVLVGVVSNQSGIARGLVTADQVAAVNARVDAIFGPFDTWRCCPHSADDGCPCRKPQPGLVLAAAADLGVAASDVVVIGDIGTDLGAAAAAGARGILVPTPVTRAEEIDAAPVSASTLAEAVALALAPACSTPHQSPTRQPSLSVPGA